MSYINREQAIEAIRKYADQKHCDGEQIEYVNGILKAVGVINELPTIDTSTVRSEKMERLTLPNSDGTYSQPTHSTFEKIFYRLAEYEDTELTPEDIEEMKIGLCDKQALLENMVD